MPVDLCFVYTQRKQAGNAWLSGAEALISSNVNVCMQSTMKRNYELCVSRSLDLMSKYAVHCVWGISYVTTSWSCQPLCCLSSC